jgi:hypothetical protein
MSETVIGPWLERERELRAEVQRLRLEVERLQLAYDALTGEPFSDRVHVALRQRVEAAEAQLRSFARIAIALQHAGVTEPLAERILRQAAQHSTHQEGPMEAEYIYKQALLMMDAVVRDTPNLTKCVNKGCQLLDNVGPVPRGADGGWIAVSIPPQRDWNVSAQGPMPVDLLMETPADQVDPNFNGPILLVGPGFAERITLQAGKAHVDIASLTPDPGMNNTLYAFDPETQRHGQSPSFSFTA